MIGYLVNAIKVNILLNRVKVAAAKVAAIFALIGHKENKCAKEKEISIILIKDDGTNEFKSIE